MSAPTPGGGGWAGLSSYTAECRLFRRQSCTQRLNMRQKTRKKNRRLEQKVRTSEAILCAHSAEINSSSPGQSWFPSSLWPPPGSGGPQCLSPGDLRDGVLRPSSSPPLRHNSDVTSTEICQNFPGIRDQDTDRVFIRSWQVRQVASFVSWNIPKIWKLWSTCEIFLYLGKNAARLGVRVLQLWTGLISPKITKKFFLRQWWHTHLSSPVLFIAGRVPPHVPVLFTAVLSSGVNILQKIQRKIGGLGRK